MIRYRVRDNLISQMSNSASVARNPDSSLIVAKPALRIRYAANLVDDLAL